MDTVTVPRDELLEKLRHNRGNHRVIFEKALEGWHQKVTEKLEEMVVDARAGRRYETVVGLPRPEDHTDEYDLVIEMLEMSVGDTIEIDQRQYRQFVRDDWGWKPDFLASTSRYV